MSTKEQYFSMEQVVQVVNNAMQYNQAQVGSFYQMSQCLDVLCALVMPVQDKQRLKAFIDSLVAINVEQHKVLSSKQIVFINKKEMN